MIIDTHCHLDSNRYLDDLEDVLKRAEDKKVSGFVIPGADISTLDRASSIANSHENIYYAAGVHPYDIEEYDLSVLKEHLNHDKCIAVGECGLDYFRLPKNDEEKLQNKDKQKSIFIEQINLAVSIKKPLIIHIREASNDSLNILKEYACDKVVGGVLHCYNASEILLELSQYNFYYGIGGVLTFKNAKKLVEILPKIPLDRVIVETDSPYLTPHPHRGQRNEPHYTSLVVEKMSEILDISKEEIENITTQNAKNLFGVF